MKSIALILWLLLPTGKEQVVLTRYLDDMASCHQTAQGLVAAYAEQGRKARFICQTVLEEVGDVDENGNPITAAK